VAALPDKKLWETSQSEFHRRTRPVPARPRGQHPSASATSKPGDVATCNLCLGSLDTYPPVTTCRKSCILWVIGRWCSYLIWGVPVAGFLNSNAYHRIRQLFERQKSSNTALQVQHDQVPQMLCLHKMIILSYTVTQLNCILSFLRPWRLKYPRENPDTLDLFIWAQGLVWNVGWDLYKFLLALAAKIPILSGCQTTIFPQVMTTRVAPRCPANAAAAGPRSVPVEKSTYGLMDWFP